MFAEPQRSKARKFEGKFSSLLAPQSKWARRTGTKLKGLTRGHLSVDNFSDSNYLRCSFHMHLSRPR